MWIGGTLFFGLVTWYWAVWIAKGFFGVDLNWKDKDAKWNDV